ncbi:hypothetical protein M405DRAFT_859552 [Rhizopogon salebrosus TDB-379]|nr:hypothetical protein M405DRAFT_859552 [Rhizopogon salebrosus TDB-379]
MPDELVVSASLASPSSLTSRPSTIYFRASYTTSLHPHATTCFPSRAQSHHQISITALAARRRREARMCPAVLKHFLGNEGMRWGAGAIDFTRTPISWLHLTASSLPTSGEGEGSEPPGTRVARLKAPSLVLKPQRKGGGNNVYHEAIPASLDSLRVEEREV